MGNKRIEDKRWTDQILNVLVVAALLAMMMAFAQTLDQVAARSIASSHSAPPAVEFSVDLAAASAPMPAAI